MRTESLGRPNMNMIHMILYTLYTNAHIDYVLKHACVAAFCFLVPILLHVLW